ncbi:MAG: PEP-CTERM sorting domain-containing protein [Gammaproteobacteria bacterium]|nr:PEP-CTERM sorting domain-containing protein [Gammaproteobacteria bacterium]
MRNFVVALKKSLAVAALSLFCSATAQASIIVVDNGATLTTTYDQTFVLTSSVTGSGMLHGIIFHNMFADVFTFGNPASSVFDFRAQVNGGAQLLLSPWMGWNYRAGLDGPSAGWAPQTGLGLLWNANTLGGAVVGDTVRLFGTMTHNKGGFHHLPDFAATTVEYSSYRGEVFATTVLAQQPAPVPTPATIALLGLGLVGLGLARKKKAA